MQVPVIIQGKIPLLGDDDDPNRIDRKINEYMKKNNVFICLSPKLVDKSSQFCSIFLFCEEYMLQIEYEQRAIVIQGNFPVSEKDDDPSRIDRRIKEYIQENNVRVIFPPLFIHEGCGSRTVLLFLENNLEE